MSVLRAASALERQFDPYNGNRFLVSRALV